VTGDWNDPDSLIILHLLLQSPTRWRALYIFKIRPQDFYRVAEAYAPLLAEIQITFAYGADADAGPGILSSNLFRTVKIARVIISGEELGALLVPNISFTWDHLTHLTLTHSDSDDWQSRGISSQTAYRLLRNQIFSELSRVLGTVRKHCSTAFVRT